MRCQGVPSDHDPCRESRRRPLCDVSDTRAKPQLGLGAEPTNGLPRTMLGL
jgi:hypothetical protein